MTPGEGRAFRRISLVVIPVYLLLVVLALLHDAHVLSVADLHTERIDVRVVDRDRAAFQVNGFDIARLGDAAKQTCVAGLFTPALGATVSYGRIGYGPLEITITPPQGAKEPAATGVLHSDDGQLPTPFADAVYMEQVDPDTKQCASIVQRRAPRLPVWGPVDVGREFRPARTYDTPEPNMLLDGMLKISAHDFLWDNLYEVASIQVPPGGRVLTAVSRPSFVARAWRWLRVTVGLLDAGADRDAIWWGAAYVDPQRTALVVTLATEAPEIALYRPYRTEADIVGVSALAQVAQDPTIVRLHIFLAILFALILFAEWSAGHLHAWRGRGGPRR